MNRRGQGSGFRVAVWEVTSREDRSFRLCSALEMRTLTYDEQHPTAFQMGDAAEAIRFESQGSCKTINLERLFSRVVSTVNVSTIRYVDIGMTSAIDSLKPLTIFPNLERIDIQNELIEDFSPLRELSKLTGLSIGYPKPRRRCLEAISELSLEYLYVEAANPLEIETIGRCTTLSRLVLRGSAVVDLRPLSKLRLKELTIGKARIESLVGLQEMDLQTAELALCQKVTSVAGISSRHFHVESCPLLKSGSLAAAKITYSLRVISQREFESLRFLEGLPKLAHLVIDVTDVKDRDIVPLLESRSLKTAWLPRRSFGDALIERVSRLNRRLIVTNGKVTYQGGELREIRQYYEGIE